MATLAALGQLMTLPRGEPVVLASTLAFLIHLAMLICAFAERHCFGCVSSSLPRTRCVGGAFGLARLIGRYRMGPTFRASLNWQHTWAGVVLDVLPVLDLLDGTLTVFDREIDRWMAPMTRLAMHRAGEGRQPQAAAVLGQAGGDRGR